MESGKEEGGVLRFYIELWRMTITLFCVFISKCIMHFVFSLMSFCEFVIVDIDNLILCNE